MLTKNSVEENGSQSPVSQEEQDEYVTGYTYKLVSWGSEPFLKEYATFKGKLGQDDALLHFEKVLFAIRTDFGHSSKGFNKGELLRVFLKNSGVDRLLGVGASQAF